MKKIVGISTTLAFVGLLCANENFKYEVTTSLNKNLSDSNSIVKNSTGFGIKLNRYFKDNIALQVGYEKYLSAKYKWEMKAKETDKDRYFINGIYEMPNKTRFTPYGLFGIGYEQVENVYIKEDSQGFLNAGIGVKYELNDLLNLTSEAKYIRRFDNLDADIALNLGIGYKFGEKVLNNLRVNQNRPNEGFFTPSSLPTSEEIADSMEELPNPVLESDTINTNENLSKTSETMDNSNLYYVQVGAWFEYQPDKKIIEKLKKIGYDYKIKNSTRKNRDVALLLAGGYRDKNEAQKALVDIIKRVKKDAFITKE